ncbi:transcription factor IIIB isoform X2 [Wolffia australiana]
MNKILEFGRRALFIARVITGYEERKIRAHRLMLQKQIEEVRYDPLAQAKREGLKRIPEQVILSEVRRMVDEMQTVLRQFEETEAAIEEYLKPLDKNAKIIMNMQLEKEEKSAKEMLRAMHQEAFLKKLEQEKVVDLRELTEKNHKKSESSAPREDDQSR